VILSDLVVVVDSLDEVDEVVVLVQVGQFVVVGLDEVDEVVVLVHVGQIVVVDLDEVVVLVLEVEAVIKGVTSVGCSIF